MLKIETSKKIHVLCVIQPSINISLKYRHYCDMLSSNKPNKLFKLKVYLIFLLDLFPQICFFLCFWHLYFLVCDLAIITKLWKLGFVCFSIYLNPPLSLVFFMLWEVKKQSWFETVLKFFLWESTFAFRISGCGSSRSWFSLGWMLSLLGCSVFPGRILLVLPAELLPSDNEKLSSSLGKSMLC